MTSERVGPEKFRTLDKYLLYLRHVFAYEFAKTTVRPTDFVLDVGCGVGYGTSMLGKVARLTVGLDTNRNVVTEAIRKYGAANVFFGRYDGVGLPVYGNNDMVVAFHVLEHIYADIAFVNELCRVLRPGGRLLLSTPNRAYRLKPDQRPWNPFHVREYDADSLRDVLLQVFPDVEIVGVCGTPEVTAIEHRRVAWAMRGGPLAAIRRAIPDSVKTLVNACRRPRDFTGKYSADDFRVTGGDVSNSLDLLALCKKP